MNNKTPYEVAKDRYLGALDALKEFERRHPRIVADLREITEEYNSSVIAVDKAIRQGPPTKFAEAGFKAWTRPQKDVDIPQLTLACPEVLLEPGVIIKVSLQNLKEVGLKLGKEKEVEAAITERTIQAISKPTGLVVAW